MSFSGVQSLSAQSVVGAAFVTAEDVQNEKRTYLDELIHIGKEVGLPSWSSDPKSVDERREDYLVHHARKRVLEIACVDNPEVKRKSYELLRRLFELDPMTGRTFTSLGDVVKELSRRIQNVMNFTGDEHRFLVEAYVSGMECFITHCLNQDFWGISPEDKNNFLDAPDLLKKLCGEEDLELRLKLKYAMELIKQLKSSTDPNDFFRSAKSLGKIGVAGLIFVASGGAAGAAAGSLVAQGALELKSQYEEAKKHAPQSWYQDVYNVRLLGQAALPSGSPITLIDEIAKLVFENTTTAPDLVAKVKKAFSSNCSWKLPVTVAHIYRDIISHYEGDQLVQVYTAALRGDATKPGLFGLLSLKDKTDKPKKTERGVLEAIQRLSSSIKFKGSPEKAQAIKGAWKLGIAPLDEKIKQKMTALLEEQKQLGENKLPENQERLEKVQAELQEVADETTRLEQISRDFAMALQFQEDEKIEKAKNVLSAQEVMQAASEARKAVGVSRNPEAINKIKKDMRENDYDPLFNTLMTDPVKTPSGTLYSRAGIEKWLETNPTDPTTRAALSKEQLIEDEETNNIKNRILAKQKAKALASQISCVSKEFAFHAWLYYGVKQGNFPKIWDAIKKGAHPAYYIDPITGNTALHLAAAMPEVDIFQLLLGHSDPESLHLENKKGETPLSIAEKQGPVYREVLTEVRSTVDPSKYGQKFHDAAGNEAIDELRAFLEGGQFIDEKIQGLTALDHAAKNRKWEAISFLIESGANVQREEMYKLLGNAAEAGYVKEVSHLLDYGLNPNGFGITEYLSEFRANDRYYALDMCRGGQNKECDFVALKNLHEIDISTLLSRLTRKNLPKTLASLGVPLLDPPLIRALSKDQFEVAEQLIERGANINTTSLLTGLNALHHAIVDGNQRKVEFILKHGASKRVKTVSGEDAWDLALKPGKEAIAAILGEKLEEKLSSNAICISDLDSNNPFSFPVHIKRLKEVRNITLQVGHGSSKEKEYHLFFN